MNIPTFNEVMQIIMNNERAEAKRLIDAMTSVLLKGGLQFEFRFTQNVKSVLSLVNSLLQQSDWKLRCKVSPFDLTQTIKICYRR